MNENMVQEIMTMIKFQFTPASRLTSAQYKRIEKGVREYVSSHAFAIWGIEDILDRADEGGYPMNKEGAKAILNIIENKQSPVTGITWEELENHIHDWFDDQVWMDKPLSELKEYDKANYVLRAGGEKEGEYRLQSDVSLDHVFHYGLDWFQNFHLPVTVVCIPYGEYEPYLLTKQDGYRERLADEFSTGNKVFKFEDPQS